MLDYVLVQMKKVTVKRDIKNCSIESIAYRSNAKPTQMAIYFYYSRENRSKPLSLFSQVICVGNLFTFTLRVKFLYTLINIYH